MISKFAKIVPFLHTKKLSPTWSYSLVLHQYLKKNVVQMNIQLLVLRYVVTIRNCTSVPVGHSQRPEIVPRPVSGGKVPSGTAASY